MKRQLNQVLKFHKISNSFIGSHASSEIPQTTKDSRIRLLREETEELIHAIKKEGIKEIAKEICDVLYVTLGTAISFGLLASLPQIFTDVHKSNLSKFDKKGRFSLSSDKNKVLKSKNYRKPNLDYIAKS